MPGIWNRFQSLMFGGAIGAALSKALEAILEPVRQHAWQKNQVRILDPRTLAELAAKGFAAEGGLTDEAARNGYDANRLAALVALAQHYPGLGEIDKLSNRSLISPAQVSKILSRHGYGEEWQAPLIALFNDLLSPVEVANAVQQGHMPNDGVLPEIDPATNLPSGYTAPTAPDGHPPSTVPLTQIDLPPIKEAAGGGVDEARLKVLANLSGLPPPQGELLQMLNRGLIDDETFNAGVREGHTKTKWIAAVKRMRWAVLSGQEYAEARLRDWITQDEMYQGGALTGHTQAQMDLFYKNRGRTATPRQVWLGIARKIVAPDYPDEPANGRLTSEHDHELAIRRSNIRPEYAPLLYDIRFNYLPVFQLNRLVAAGAVTPDTAATWAEYNLTAPDVVEALRAYWQTTYPGPLTGPKATVSAEVKSARTKLLSKLHTLYVTGKADDIQALAALTAEAYDQTVIDGLLQTWGNEKALIDSVNQPPPGGPLT